MFIKSQNAIFRKNGLHRSLPRSILEKAANNYVTKLLSKRTQVDTVGVSRVCPIKCCSEKSNRLAGCLLSQLGDPILVLSLKLFTNRLRQLTIIL